jgi:protein-tyrosine phosphatase
MLADADITDLEIRTAGVMTVPGLMPTQECRQLLLKDGIDISNHRSCQLTHELIKRASLILGMTSFHVQMALRMAESARGKTFLIKEYTGGDSKNDQVQDPMGCTLEVYKKVYREIRAACRRLMKTEFVQSFVKGRKPLRKHPPAPAGEVRPLRKKAAGRAAAKARRAASTQADVSRKIRRRASAKAPQKRAAKPSRTGGPPAAARVQVEAARKNVRTASGGTAHRRTPAIGGRVTSGKRAKRR